MVVRETDKINTWEIMEIHSWVCDSGAGNLNEVLLFKVGTLGRREKGCNAKLHLPQDQDVHGRLHVGSSIYMSASFVPITILIVGNCKMLGLDLPDRS